MASAATEDNQIGQPESTCSPAICCTLSILLIIGIFSSTQLTVMRLWCWLAAASKCLIFSSEATLTGPLIACDDELTIRGTETSVPLLLSNCVVETEGATSCTEDLFDSFSFSFSYSSARSLFEESFEQMHPIFLQKGCCFVSPINQQITTFLRNLLSLLSNWVHLYFVGNPEAPTLLIPLVK